MKSRHLFLVAGILFFTISGYEFFHAHSRIATVLNGISGVIFLYLGLARRNGGASRTKRRR